SRLPPTVATHWNLKGVPNGFSSRLLAVSMIPLLILAMTGLFNVLPRLHPGPENHAKFIHVYWLIATAVLVFLAIAHVLVISSALGFPVKIDRFMPLGIGLLFIFLGNYLTRVEPNWFVGIRTPWTLSSDTVWRKTHRTGGALMVIGGLILAISAFLPRPAFLVLFCVTIVIVAVIPIVQSYVLWKREQHDRP